MPAKILEFQANSKARIKIYREKKKKFNLMYELATRCHIQFKSFFLYFSNPVYFMRDEILARTRLNMLFSPALPVIGFLYYNPEQILSKY